MLLDTFKEIKNEDTMQPKQHYKNDNDVKIAVLETSVGHVNQTLERIEKRFDRFEEKMESGFSQTNNKLDKIDSRLWQVFFWLITGLTGLAITMAKGFHWIGS